MKPSTRVWVSALSATLLDCTERTPLVAVRPAPAIAVTRSAIDSFFDELSSASTIAIESLATLTAAADNSFKSRAITAEAAERPLPANNVARASVVVSCSVEPSESRVKNVSEAAGVAELNSDISIARAEIESTPPA